MINASTAKREAILNSKALEYMKNIEKAIDNAVKNGEMETKIHHSIKAHDGKELSSAIKEKLTDLGYSVYFVFAEPLPTKCPSDQWIFDNGTITIKWD